MKPDWIDVINLMVVTCGFTITLMGLVVSLSVSYLEKQNRRFLILFFSVLSLYTSSDIISQLSLTFLGPGYMLLSKAAVFSESFFSSVCMPLLTFYILVCAGQNVRKNLLLISSAAVWLVYFVLLIYTQFSTVIYYFTDDNAYHRGPFYPLLLTPPVLLMLINLVSLYRFRSSLSKRQLKAFTIYLLIPLFCMVVQMLWYGVLMIVAGTSVASAFMLYFIIREQMDLYVRQRQEIGAQKVSILMLEMRPHFIYNTLTSIYYLCDQDVKKAQQVTLDFSVYLRKNFTAISKKGTIPFAEELEHTKAYLSVEMARYEGMLSVEYDFTDMPRFRIPPLTLQPVVENSIKHGLDPEYDPLHIVIHVREVPGGNRIIVEDNGCGFTDKKTGDPHIAINNIRERLKLMCNGTLEITPREGGGTTVSIFIPF